jgi:hypothetical protein
VACGGPGAAAADGAADGAGGGGAGDRAGLGQGTRKSIRGGRRCHWGDAWGRPPVLASSAPSWDRSAPGGWCRPRRYPANLCPHCHLQRSHLRRQHCRSPISGPPAGTPLRFVWVATLATTVTATLGGVSGIRTADRMSIASEFQIMDVTSPAAAAELGRRLGAGSVLRGALVAGDHRLGASRQPRSSDRLDRLGLAAPDMASRAVRARDGGLVFHAVDPRYEPGASGSSIPVPAPTDRVSG